jgi:hypothetical protein
VILQKIEGLALIISLARLLRCHPSEIPPIGFRNE